MPGSDNQSCMSVKDVRCTACQHCVEVRGMDQIVCLAFLSICSSKRDGGCCEFESKRKINESNSGLR